MKAHTKRPIPVPHSATAKSSGPPTSESINERRLQVGVIREKATRIMVRQLWEDAGRPDSDVGFRSGWKSRARCCHKARTKTSLELPASPRCQMNAYHSTRNPLVVETRCRSIQFPCLKYATGSFITATIPKGLTPPPILSTVPQRLQKATSKPTVLIAEGDEATRDATRQYLLLHGFEVETATGGIECLEKLRCGTTRVVVLDSDLAWGGGDGVLAVMREEPSLSHIPVVLTTTRLGLDQVSFALAPVLHILEKPFVLESLLESIRFLAWQCGRMTGSRTRSCRGTEGHS